MNEIPIHGDRSPIEEIADYPYCRKCGGIIEMEEA